MKYVSQGPMLLDVHMHRPNTNSKNFMDALLAFWPGLQVYIINCYIKKNLFVHLTFLIYLTIFLYKVLKGDIKPAVETHEMLYQVMQRHNFIPEAFTTDFQVHIIYTIDKIYRIYHFYIMSFLCYIITFGKIGTLGTSSTQTRIFRINILLISSHRRSLLFRSRT